jgi:hypothetical protein
MAIVPAGYYESQAPADQFAMAFINPGTTVVSDMGAVFNQMADIVEGEHLTVNHSKFYKDPKTGVHLIKAWMNRHGRGNCSEDVLWRNCAPRGSSGTRTASGRCFLQCFCWLCSTNGVLID